MCECAARSCHACTQLSRSSPGSPRKQNLLGKTTEVHAKVRGSTGRLQTRQHAERCRLEQCYCARSTLIGGAALSRASRATATPHWSTTSLTTVCTTSSHNSPWDVYRTTDHRRRPPGQPTRAGRLRRALPSARRNRVERRHLRRGGRRGHCAEPPRRSGGSPQRRRHPVQHHDRVAFASAIRIRHRWHHHRRLVLQLSDGAAALVIMSRDKADELGLQWLAEISAHGAVAGSRSGLHCTVGTDSASHCSP